MRRNITVYCILTEIVSKTKLFPGFKQKHVTTPSIFLSVTVNKNKILRAIYDSGSNVTLINRIEY